MGRKLRFVGAATTVFVLLGVLLWHNVLTYALGLGIDSPDSLVPIKVPATLTPAESGPIAGIPERIVIPSIKLNAKIEQLSITAHGSLGVPADPLNAGWYTLGPRPGENGSAVLDGHVNWFHGATGVFKDLHSLKAGDTIVVQDDKGENTLFTVRDIRTYKAGADATEVFSSGDGKSHLNLITCDGVWDKTTHGYTKRLVIFADKQL